jgi:hypothetical protein
MRPRAALDHARQHGVVHVQRTDQVDGDESCPTTPCVGLQERAEHVPAGVVDQHVDRAELRSDARYGRIDLVAPGDVAAKALRGAARGPDLAGHPVGGGLVEIEHGDLGAFLGEAPAGRPADAAAAARHDDGLAFESLHGVLL